MEFIKKTMSSLSSRGDDSKVNKTKSSGCPFHTKQATVMANQWWPEQINLRSLTSALPPSAQKQAETYKEDFLSLDLDEVKKDIFSMMKTSVDWWPADYGHYGPFFIRLAWHAAGTYRTFDGRGGSATGNIRLAPLNSWPDNTNLDKARRLLWPIKKKYGKKLSWGDLMIFTGNCALEDMGLQPFGFGGGRIDAWEPEQDIYWGPEQTWLDAKRGGLGPALDEQMGAVQMGLIYVNPEGPGGNPDPLKAAQDIRTTFSRMAMNDVETVALIAGGHTFGKAHGAAPADKHVGPEPEGATIEEQGFGWTSNYKSGVGADAITSGLEGAWTAHPTRWGNGYFYNLFKYEWKMTKSPAGATQWIPTDPSASSRIPDAHVEGLTHAPIMFTTDLALIKDEAYRKISKEFYEHPEKFADAFARAWYKLCHRDMGPVERLLGKYVPEAQIWQDPIPKLTHQLVTDGQVAHLKSEILSLPDVSPAAFIRLAWANAATFRHTDLRGGSNGARVRLAPQKDWQVNNPEELAKTLSALETIQKKFNETSGQSFWSWSGNSQISMADLIVLAGAAAIEVSAKQGGFENCTVPFTPGRGDATDEGTDADSFSVLEPTSDAFRNYLGPTKKGSPQDLGAKAEALMIDHAQKLTLSKSEMTVLIGGMRAMNCNADSSDLGVFTRNPGALSNDFFVNLLDMNTKWNKSVDDENIYEGRDRSSGELKWKGSRVDLVFGSNSELRMIAEYYGCDDSKDIFLNDFVKAWSKVMKLGF